MNEKTFKKGLVLGNRIPKEYFVAMGCGQIDRGSGKDPWETGSYDLALLDAGLLEENRMALTSAGLPPNTRDMPIQQLRQKFCELP